MLNLLSVEDGTKDKTMKIKFKAKGTMQPDYDINNETINGVDLSQFPQGGQFIGDESTQEAGIYDVIHNGTELVVTLAQCGLAYECSPVNRSHDWQESELIDSTEYDENTCYIIASSKPEDAEYVKREQGFTVAIPTQEDNDELV